MKAGSLRRTLYLGTRDLHEVLDKNIGTLADCSDYARYLLGTFQFRAALEPSLADTDFPTLELVDDLRQDLEDLGVSAKACLQPLVLDTHATKLAAMYVSEGSAVGARLIARRVAVLGLDKNFGARHLARQIADQRRWPAFLEWLEAQEDATGQAVIEARRIFMLAMQAYQVDA
ncbi:biliverdin-producing heme oxygenase [Paracoccus aestuariivivens]|uniref:Heme oxygenase n=1 Tax=Paracoccus aestuariivivens TaxID=1820333 RepID=A0A6L6JDG6_9RHOB|nr:biliverdin-producing heme oxygenase [Paracoccus aestuariivivens]MTH80152.1 hypothetical protein [Paracoccus aestuariivivens]